MLAENALRSKLHLIDAAFFVDDSRISCLYKFESEWLCEPMHVMFVCFCYVCSVLALENVINIFFLKRSKITKWKALTQFGFISHTFFLFIISLSQPTTSRCQWPVASLQTLEELRPLPEPPGGVRCTVDRPAALRTLWSRSSCPTVPPRLPPPLPLLFPLLPPGPHRPPQAHLDSPPTFSLHEGQAEVPGALDVAPPSLRLASSGDLGDLRGLKDLGQQLCHDVSTLTGDWKAAEWRRDERVSIMCCHDRTCTSRGQYSSDASALMGQVLVSFIHGL